ncbi:MAG: cytochrome c [Bacteroidota bacterium]
MKSTHKILLALAAPLLAMGLFSCQQAGGNQTGSEFIPDMAHSVAYEANLVTDYYYNTWDKESTFTRYQLSQPRLPVPGTMPRGFAGGMGDGIFPSAEAAVLAQLKAAQATGGIAYTPNGHVPYYFPDTEPGRTEASQKILYNPYPISKNGLARGQELYTIYCGICHGVKGDGNGDITTTGKYPPQPANLLDSVQFSNGRFYHAIMFGKNTMAGYGDKLSFEERWQVIHYIRSMQAGKAKLVYSDTLNTFNPQFGVTETRSKELAATLKPAVQAPVQDTTLQSQSPGHETTTNDHQH